ncbi:class III lanthionine synthetase LanKC [Kitasatospora sp. CM 4170]|uniref:non-specific serine/threonine protein kinase n=1 Tax=Kitasatospora aburaviensis TaxID=67265 RepID=A0ABW1F4K3_9ACTN|nr:class III lanthionine synthetase LanKC [Kitasatospora sp. CM 4170]WNM49846.1 class III lanthionine synthetase LanKC [Kitasatospora sp. CM 4170]
MRRFDEYQAFAVADPLFFDTLGRAPFDPDLQREMSELVGADGEVTESGVWAGCRAVAAPPLPEHGWKIHVSAVPEDAAVALRAVAAEFHRTPFHFKCLRSTRLVRLGAARWWPPGQIGKVVVIYTHSAEQCRELLARLAGPLADVRGPYVLTDRRYGKSGCLYYRYGEFISSGTVGADGTARSVLHGPDGRRWTDDRDPVYRRPPWVPELCDEEQADGSGSHVLHGYQVVRALHYGGAGGVYLARRVSDGREVVLKEARPHTAHAEDGSDAQQRLRREFEALQLLSGTGVAPEPLELFEEWEHLFLAEEFVDGMALVTFIGRSNPIAGNAVTEQGVAEYAKVVDTVVDGLREALAACHARDLVHGDVSLTNVVVDPETLRVRLIDFESVRSLSARQDQYPGTPGFAPAMPAQPTTADGRTSGDSAVADRATDGRAFDEYALAAVELAMLLPRNTLLALDPPALARSTRHVAALLRRPVDGLLHALGLPLDEAPEQRLDLPDAVARAVGFMEAVMTPEREDRPFPADPAVFRTNPWSVAHGAAGVLRAVHGITGRFPEPIRDWMVRAEPRLDRLPPGLCYGLAGVAWTLCDAGEPDWGAAVLDRALRTASGTAGGSGTATASGTTRATAAADALPADLATGSAGLGLACLALWRGIGETRHLHEAARIADGLVEAAEDAGQGLYWSDGTGRPPQIGYAHGSSGIALFLLYLHCATGDDRYLRVGRRALAHDLAQGVVQGDGMLSIPGRVGSAVYSPYWLRGSAGVGTALARYCALLPDEEPLHRALDGILRRGVGGVTITTGLYRGMAGPTNLALDCVRLLDRPDLREPAERSARAILSLAGRRPEGLAFPGESLLRYSTDFATGSAGIALVLDRLHRGSADFNYTLDELLPATGAGPVPAGAAAAAGTPGTPGTVGGRDA